MLWRIVVALLVVLAVYVSVGRLLVANLAFYKDPILQELSVRQPFTIEAETISGGWTGFTPHIVLKELRLISLHTDEPPVLLSQGRLAVDVWRSLRTLSLQVTRVEFTGLILRGVIGPNGGIQLTGLEGGDGPVGTWLQDFLLNVEAIALRDNILRLKIEEGDERDLGLEVLLAREGSLRRLDAQLTSTAGSTLTLLAEGTGNPFNLDHFTGTAYLNFQSGDLAAIYPLMGPNAPRIWVAGAGELQFWLKWQDGESSARAQLDAQNLELEAVNGDWTVPLERFSMQAELEESDSHRRLYASDIVLERGDSSLRLPAIQFDWDKENELSLLARDINLATAAGVFKQVETAPETLREVFASLDPRGQVDLLRISVMDADDPLVEWEAEANFSNVSVEPYRGAPGVINGRGYTRFSQEGGEVIIDSQDLSLAFPTIYHEPLVYDQAYGTLTLDWDSDSLRIGSGLVTAEAAEGSAKVLFGLNIPFEATPQGLEMDLMVGLQDFHPDVRQKYLPYIIPEGLLGWLQGSLGDGLIREGAFLWRGSLKSGAKAMRTMQLGFNASDIYVNYDERWPPATINDGVALIDDEKVSVWAYKAALFDSLAEDVSVETSVNPVSKKAVLSLHGTLEGPASDGLRFLNETPLTPLLGGAFKQWDASGALATELDLQLELSNEPPPPIVEATAQLQDVDLQVEPGNIPLAAVNGEFGISTKTGYRARGLKGKLWGQTVTASISQHHPAGKNHYVAGASEVRVNFDTRAEMSQLRQWLGLDMLRFAQGRTAVNGSIRLVPGKTPALHLGSDLQGVSLDLPRPWAKEAQASRRFSFVMPLGASGEPLALALAPDLRLNLALQDGGLRGGVLAVNTAPTAIEQGLFQVIGQAPVIEVDPLIEFVSEYFVPAEQEGAAPEAISAAPGPATPRIVVNDFHAQEVHAFGQSLQDVDASLDFKQERWELELDAGWIRGSGFLARDGGMSSLTADYLNMDYLAGLQLLQEPLLEPSLEGLDVAPGVGAEGDAPAATAAEAQAVANVTGEAESQVAQAAGQAVVEQQAALEIQPIQVELKNMYYGEQRLGEMSFVLQATDGTATLENIGGVLADLRFSAETDNRLTWRHGEEEANTELSATLAFTNIGTTMEMLGYERIVESEEGDLVIDLTWPGSPADVSLEAGSGRIRWRMGEGSFHQAPASASGALRVVSVLNLADIIRRLSLSHMFESGIPFDSLETTILLDDGVIAVPKASVRGGSSFSFRGRSVIDERSLEGELVATLPVANNLPWIAALTANLPIAAGVFVISKIFDKQMTRLSSVVYGVSGTWDEPQINFSRVFDDASSGAPVVEQAEEVEEQADVGDGTGADAPRE